MNLVTPSIYQQSIFNWTADPNPAHRVAMIQAVAGSGKTTTIVQCTRFIPPHLKTLFVAFAKKNVEDLKTKLPANTEAATLNSIGHRAWLKFAGIFKIEVNGDLNYEYINELIEPGSGKLDPSIIKLLSDRCFKTHGEGVEFNRYNRLLHGNFSEEAQDINRLIALAKASGLVPNKLIQATGYDYNILMEDTDDNWRGLIESYDLSINFQDVAIEVSRREMIKSVVMADSVIDYDSQLWLPVIHRATFSQYDWLLVDECQDLNRVQVEITTHLMKPDGRAIFVGDSFQSIFGFRGALCGSMQFIKGYFDAYEMPLSICYRCPKSVANRQWHLVGIKVALNK